MIPLAPVVSVSWCEAKTGLRSKRMACSTHLQHTIEALVNIRVEVVNIADEFHSAIGKLDVRWQPLDLSESWHIYCFAIDGGVMSQVNDIVFRNCRFHFTCVFENVWQEDSVMRKNSLESILQRK
jgi:hypothetical protein